MVCGSGVRAKARTYHKGNGKGGDSVGLEPELTEGRGKDGSGCMFVRVQRQSQSKFRGDDNQKGDGKGWCGCNSKSPSRSPLRG